MGIEMLCDYLDILVSPAGQTHNNAITFTNAVGFCHLVELRDSVGAL